jgi:hypothetical protein
MSVELTEQQLQRLAYYKTKWAEIGECCDPVSLEDARPYVEEVYRAAGAAAPQYVVLTDSPADCAATGAMLSHTSAVDFLQLFFEPTNTATIASEYRKALPPEATPAQRRAAIEAVAADFVRSAVDQLGL